MKNKMLQIIIVLLMFTIGCSMNDSSSKDLNSRSINYEPNNDREQVEEIPEIDFSNYEQSKRRLKEHREDDIQNQNLDIYENEETAQVTEHLKNHSKIIDAQVATIDDRIIVGVLTTDRGDQGIQENQDIAYEIEREVRTIVQDKEIIVYTDYMYWNSVKDEMASEGASSFGKNAEEFLENFFNVEIKE